MQEEHPKRMSQVSFYVTRETREFCAQVAKAAGMSHSQLWAAIAERLHQGGFSPAVFTRVAIQLQRRLKVKGSMPTLIQFGLWNPFEHLPPLPFAEELERPLTPEEAAEMLEELETVAASIKERISK